MVKLHAIKNYKMGIDQYHIQNLIVRTASTSSIFVSAATNIVISISFWQTERWLLLHQCITNRFTLIASGVKNKSIMKPEKACTETTKVIKNSIYEKRWERKVLSLIFEFLRTKKWYGIVEEKQRQQDSMGKRT